MSIFMPSRTSGYELCHPIDEDDFETITLLINGQPRQSSWKPVAMQLIRSDRGRVLQPADSPWLGEHALVFKDSAVAVLKPTLREYGELLPLECAGVELCVFNPTRVVDALDEEASSVMRFDDGELMGITRHVFQPDVMQGADIFKIPNLRSSSTYVSDRIVNLWNSSGLRGLEFQKVWPLD